MSHDAREHDPLRRYLDGEMEFTDLPDPVRAEARAWDRLLASVRIEHPGAPAPAWLEDRIMAEIGEVDSPGLLARAWEWLVRPRPVRLSPLTMGVAMAGVATLILAPWGRPGATGPLGVPASDTGTAVLASTVEAPVVYVQFILEAPGARSVSVGGDFDGWRGSHELADPDGDGIWTGRVPMEPGVHTYMFLVDGNEWVTDPEAQRYTDDGFGNRNAVLALTDPRA